MRNWLIAWIFTVSWSVAYGQSDSITLDVNYTFRDGVYHTLVDLQKNQPDISLNHLDGRLVLQKNRKLVKVEYLHYKGNTERKLWPDEIEVIVIDGLPYVRALHDTTRQFTMYAGLHIKGRLSYFTYAETVEDTIMMKAYNPYNGHPFRYKEVVRERDIEIERLVDLARGEIYDFSLSNVLKLIEDDKALRTSLENLDEEGARERLYKCLLIYDDRHPLLMP